MATTAAAPHVSTPTYTYHPDEYTVGWICALPIELQAAIAMLDSTHGPLETSPRHDNNHYHLGNIGRHKIAITCLPEYGLVNAATTAKSMQATFRRLRFGLMIGIGGGIPSADVDIRLGDIAVSLPSEQHGGVLQYDLGRLEIEGFRRVGSLDRPPRLLLGAIPTLRATRGLSRQIFDEVANVFGEDDDDDEEWMYPGSTKDVLFRAEHNHIGKNPTCQACIGDGSEIVDREERKKEWPKIHYGNIASGNTVMKDPKMRDRLGEEEHVICFEMEAAGLMNDFPYLVVRGICDYADSHKNKKWQPYAAAVAAVYAKKLLQVITPGAMEDSEPIKST